MNTAVMKCHPDQWLYLMVKKKRGQNECQTGKILSGMRMIFLPGSRIQARSDCQSFNLRCLFDLPVPEAHLSQVLDEGLGVEVFTGHDAGLIELHCLREPVLDAVMDCQRLEVIEDV